jgi:hypothetical protein
MTTDPKDNDPPEKFHFPPHPDERAMRQYRNLPDPVELARLAALLASPAKPATPTAQVEAALDLSLEAHEATIRRREAMVAAMDSTTLSSLQTKLMAELKGDGKLTREENLAHPLVGPVLRESERRGKQAWKDHKESEAASIKAALERSDRRSSPLKRPSLPCSLPKALLYATGAKGKDEPALDFAFRDFLVVCEALNERNADEQKAEDARAWIQRLEDTLRSLEPAADKPQELEAVRKRANGRRKGKKAKSQEAQADQHNKAREQRLAEIRDHKANLARIEARLRCATGFTPNTPVPQELRTAAEATYEKHWRGQNAVRHEGSLAWIATDFHDFWVNFGPFYLKQLAQSEAIQKAKETGRALGATAATQTREHKKWPSFVALFAEWSKAQPANTDLLRLVDTFPKQPKVDLNKGRALLKTLLKALKNPSVEKELPDLLLYEGFNAGPKTPPKINIGEGTIPECLRIVKNHFGGPRSRPEPKPKGPQGVEP